MNNNRYCCTGPSCGVNTACSSSMYALDMATKYIQNGQCDGAIVCSSNFCFCNTEIFVLSPLMNSTGISAPFDANGRCLVHLDYNVAGHLQYSSMKKETYLGFQLNSQRGLTLELKIHHTKFCAPSSEGVGATDPQGKVIFEKKHVFFVIYIP